MSQHVSFSIILCGLSRVLSLSLYGYEFNIYGYLFWVVIVLGIINVWAVFRIGKPLKELLYSQKKYEANFRYGLSIVRNNKNSIYDNQFEKREYVLPRKNFNKVVDNFYKVTFYKAKIDIVRSFFVQSILLDWNNFSITMLSCKSISFGQIIQVQSVFYNVISPMLFLVFWYENLVELRTNVSRLSELKKIDADFTTAEKY